MAFALHQRAALLRSSPVLPARSQRLVSVKAAQVETTEAAVAATTASDAGSEIYIGFSKGDTAPRSGRKGRVIRDDPSKYPSKEDLGFLSGATGGWAGGEAGLWKLREEVIAQKQQKKAAASGTKSPAPTPAVPAAEGGKAPIYVGYGKYDTDARKAGVPGRFIVDEPAKYPGKEDVGFLKGATGGFAAGEKGLKQFIRDGDLQLRREGEPGGNQASPVAAAFLLVLAGAGGGLLLNALADAATAGVRAELAQVPVDDSIKSLILVGSGLGAVALLLLAGRVVASQMQERISTNVDRLLLIVGASAAVFVGARAILEL